jgi:hypothetical protein
MSALRQFTPSEVEEAATIAFSGLRDSEQVFRFFSDDKYVKMVRNNAVAMLLDIAEGDEINDWPQRFTAAGEALFETGLHLGIALGRAEVRR